MEGCLAAEPPFSRVAEMANALTIVLLRRQRVLCQYFREADGRE